MDTRDGPTLRAVDQPWLVALLIVAVIGVVALRSWIRSRQVQAIAREHPPGNSRHTLAMTAVLIVLVALVVARIADNAWWLVLAAPAFPIMIYIERQRRRARAADVSG